MQFVYGISIGLIVGAVGGGYLVYRYADQVKAYLKRVL